jgi:hypothetical protein
MTHLHRDQTAIALFAVSRNPVSVIRKVYVDGILGQKHDEFGAKAFEYRLGYCPIEFDGPFAVAKTFLLPGYRGTPEYGLLHRKTSNTSERAKLLSLVEDHTRDYRQAEQWMPLVKWFHENGIPQVRGSSQSYDKILETRIEEMWQMTQTDS